MKQPKPVPHSVRGLKIFKNDKKTPLLNDKPQKTKNVMGQYCTDQFKYSTLLDYLKSFPLSPESLQQKEADLYEFEIWLPYNEK